MWGTVINAACVLAGGAAGLLKAPTPRAATQHWLKLACGAAALFVGFHVVWRNVNGPALAILKQLAIVFAALVLGRLTGRWLGLQRSLNQAGRFASAHLVDPAHARASSFHENFAAASVIFCLAPLALLGPILEGLGSDARPLVVKAAIDGLAAWSLGRSARWGVLAATFPLFCLQGTITLASQAAAPWLEARELAAPICTVAGLLVVFVSLMIFGLSRIQMADYFPSLLWAPMLTWLLA
ncbi:MAG: DUF554 family protein [Bryobacteraceae bacterium]|nr:DUF554 family protein [Bryobacteraceae bacterium]